MAQQPQGPDPLDGPFMTAGQLTDYSDEPGYAILPQHMAEDGPLYRQCEARKTPHPAHAWARGEYWCEGRGYGVAVTTSEGR